MSAERELQTRGQSDTRPSWWSLPTSHATLTALLMATFLSDAIISLININRAWALTIISSAALAILVVEKFSHFLTIRRKTPQDTNQRNQNRLTLYRRYEHAASLLTSSSAVERVAAAHLIAELADGFRILKDTSGFQSCCDLLATYLRSSTQDSENVDTAVPVVVQIFFSRLAAGANEDDSSSRLHLNSVSLRNADLRGITIRGVRLTDVDLSHAQLADAQISQSEFSNVRLSQGNLSHTRISDTHFYNVDAGGANLSSASLLRVYASNVDLSRTTLDESTLEDCKFLNVDFSKSDANFSSFHGTTMHRVDFSKSNAQEGDFANTHLRNIDFSHTQLAGAKFNGSNLTSIDFSRASLGRADLSFAHLKQVNFPFADLAESSLVSASLHDVDFSFATLTASKFLDVKASGNIDFRGADLSETFLTPLLTHITEESVRERLEARLLSETKLFRYEFTGDANDLDDAIEQGLKAVELTPAGTTNRSAVLSELGIALRERSRRNGNHTDLDAAIGLLLEAQNVETDKASRNAVLANLAISLQERYEYTSDKEDLDKAINFAANVLGASTARDVPYTSELRSALASALYRRFQDWHDYSDLDAGIEQSRALLAEVTEAEELSPSALSNLASALLIRFDRAGDSENLDEAIALLRQATTRLTNEDTDQAAVLSNLATALLRRFEHSGDAALLDEAVAILDKALRTVPYNDPQREAIVHNLARAERQRGSEYDDARV